MSGIGAHVVVWASLLAGAVACARWLRVAQREHYGVGRTSRFARRWWLLGWQNRALVGVAAAGVVASGAFWWAPAVTAAAVLAGPLGLGLRGRTSPLAWTRRLVTLAASAALGAAVATGLSLLGGVAAPVVAALVFGLPVWVDLTLAAVAPVEALLARRWVHQAQKRLDSVDPVRVAITGSYGKTTIKGYVRQLAEPSRTVVATPASFNNTPGLCRTINEHLAAGTEVFVAEMGTFGTGEIAAMTRWVRPSVSVLASIGPVHLERFGSVDRIVSAKAEIFATSRTAILNVDAYGLAAEADRLAASGLRVLRCSTQDADADVTVLPEEPLDEPSTRVPPNKPVHRITVMGRKVAVASLGHAEPSNVACAVATASVLGIADAEIAARLGDLPTPDHRRKVARSPSGVVVIDNTYNSNPAGARAALALLAETPAERRAVVTPGMVELGRRQNTENQALAAEAAEIADDLIVVGRTNQAALLAGAAGVELADAKRNKAAAGEAIESAGSATVRWVANREEAVAWVRENYGKGDAVLYENDLPDHHP